MFYRQRAYRSFRRTDLLYRKDLRAIAQIIRYGVFLLDENVDDAKTVQKATDLNGVWL